jgi:hypothetical protein
MLVAPLCRRRYPILIYVYYQLENPMPIASIRALAPTVEPPENRPESARLARVGRLPVVP